MRHTVVNRPFSHVIIPSMQNANRRPLLQNFLRQIQPRQLVAIQLSVWPVILTVVTFIRALFTRAFRALHERCIFHCSSLFLSNSMPCTLFSCLSLRPTAISSPVCQFDKPFLSWRPRICLLRRPCSQYHPCSEYIVATKMFLHDQKVTLADLGAFDDEGASIPKCPHIDVFSARWRKYRFIAANHTPQRLADNFLYRCIRV